MCGKGSDKSGVIVWRGRQLVIVVGTGFVVGEDYPSGGRLLLFEVLPPERRPGEVAGRDDPWRSRLLTTRRAFLSHTTAEQGEGKE